MVTKSIAIPPLTDRQLERYAGSAIAGYQYQFERSVVELLKLQSGDRMRIEGIEDIDIWTSEPSIVQVKYLEAQSWSLAVVRNAVHELLKSFVTGEKVTYVLYIYCGIGPEPPSSLNLDELKQCLTYKPKDKPPVRLYETYSEDDLEAFANAFEIRFGVSLDAQRKQTVDAISKALNCDEFEAESLHRMRAVQFLYEVALRKDEKDREISRLDLMKIFSDKEIFYTRWHKEIVGKTKFLHAVYKKIQLAGFNDVRLIRGIYLEIVPSNIEQICLLAETIARDMDGAQKNRVTVAQPWVLILRGDMHLVTEVKRHLIKKHFSFNDGYEEIYFSPELFAKPPVVNSRGKGSKLAVSSYYLRVINENTVSESLEIRLKIGRLISLVSPDDICRELSVDKTVFLNQIEIGELRELIERVTA